jgi:hypothetical protein
MQTCATDNSGSYTNCTLSQLKADEPTLSNTDPALAFGASPTSSTYTLTSTPSATGDVFTLVESNGVETRTCTSTNPAPGNGGCAGGTW